MPKYTTQQHHSKNTHTYTKQQTQNIKPHSTRTHQHVLYKIFRQKHKQNPIAHKSPTKQHNFNTKPMATTM
jgi:hypothetical protein